MREAMRVMLARLLAVILMAAMPAKSDAGAILGRIGGSTTECCCCVDDTSCPAHPSKDPSKPACCICCLVPMTSAFTRPAPLTIIGVEPSARIVVRRADVPCGRAIEPETPVPILA